MIGWKGHHDGALCIKAVLNMSYLIWLAITMCHFPALARRDESELSARKAIEGSLLRVEKTGALSITGEDGVMTRGRVEDFRLH
jgi:hypothetical protein